MVVLCRVAILETVYTTKTDVEVPFIYSHKDMHTCVTNIITEKETLNMRAEIWEGFSREGN